jgi:hypothetical protein
LELKAEGKALLKRANDAVTNRTDPEMIAESDRMMEVRKDYHAQLSEYEAQLEEAGGGPQAEGELKRQGIEKPEHGERYQEGVVRSYEEKKALVSVLADVTLGSGRTH